VVIVISPMQRCLKLADESVFSYKTGAKIGVPGRTLTLIEGSGIIMACARVSYSIQPDQPKGHRRL